MKLLVCAKQVLDTENCGVPNIEGRMLRVPENPVFRMNRNDEFAVEAAMSVKEAVENAFVDIVTVGPERSDAVLRRAIGMGADHGIHILTADDCRLEAGQTAGLIAQMAAGRSYDLIFTGVMSEDDMNSMVGAMVAERLEMPFTSAVMAWRFSRESRCVEVEREIEGGCREIIEMRLPAVMAFQTGANRPRYPSLSKLLRANKAALEIITAADLERPARLIRTEGYAEPVGTRTCRMLEGPPDEKARALLKVLGEKGFIR